METLKLQAQEIASQYFPNKSQAQNRDDLVNRIMKLEVPSGDGSGQIQKLQDQLEAVNNQLLDEKARHETTTEMLNTEKEEHNKTKAALEAQHNAGGDATTKIQELETALKDEQEAHNSKTQLLDQATKATPKK